MPSILAYMPTWSAMSNTCKTPMRNSSLSLRFLGLIQDILKSLLKPIQLLIDLRFLLRRIYTSYKNITFMDQLVMKDKMEKMTAVIAQAKAFLDFEDAFLEISELEDSLLTIDCESIGPSDESNEKMVWYSNTGSFHNINSLPKARH